MNIHKYSRMPEEFFSAKFDTRSHQLYFVSDVNNWVLDDVAHSLKTELQNQHGVQSKVVAFPQFLKNQIVHFIDRYSYLTRLHARMSDSNLMFLTWYHGDYDDPAMAPFFESLMRTEQHLKKIVTSCQASRSDLLKAGVSPSKMVIIPIGVDLELFRPPGPGQRTLIRKRLGIPGDAVCIGSFQKDGSGWGKGTSPKYVKGPDIFLETVAELKNAYPNIFVLLTAPARGYVKAGLEQLGIPYVHHILTDYGQIAPYYWALDLYIISSRTEGGPKGLVESWATGVPVVSTRMGMPADLIQHKHNGMLADIEDAAALAAHAAVIIEDHTLRRHIIENASQDVQAYSWPAIARRYYRELYLPYAHV